MKILMLCLLLSCLPLLADEDYYGTGLCFPVRAIHAGTWIPLTEPVKTDIGKGFLFGFDYRGRSRNGLGGDMSFNFLLKRQNDYGTGLKAVNSSTFLFPTNIDVTYCVYTDSPVIPYIGTGINVTMGVLCFSEKTKDAIIVQQISGTSLGLNFLIGTDILFNRDRARCFIEGRINLNTAGTEWEYDYKNYRMGKSKINIHGVTIVTGVGL